MATTPLLQALQGYLQVTADRQQLVTTNMANVDTPGYHTQDVNFQTAMQQVMDQSGNMKLQPASVEVDNLPERPDGNNVSVERESLLLAEAQMKFNLGIQLLKDQFHLISSAINSGGTTS